MTAKLTVWVINVYPFSFFFRVIKTSGTSRRHRANRREKYAQCHVLASPTVANEHVVCAAAKSDTAHSLPYALRTRTE